MAKKASSKRKYDLFGLVKGYPHPRFAQIRDLAREFGVETHEYRAGMQWQFRCAVRLVDYFPEDRSLILRNEWHGARTGDYAIAIAVALTGINPQCSSSDDPYRLCNTIRNYGRLKAVRDRRAQKKASKHAALSSNDRLLEHVRRTFKR